MCVDTHNYKCCCGCFSLTQATLLMGLLYVIGAIATAVAGIWYEFAVYCVMSSIFVMILVKPRCAGTRKLLYYIYLILSVLGAIAFVIWTIILFTGDFEHDWCTDADNIKDYDQFFDDYDECMDWINMMAIICVIFAALVGIPCALCVLQILYYGWREQENASNETYSRNIAYGQGHQQNHTVPVGGQPTAGYMPANQTPDGGYNPNNMA